MYKVKYNEEFGDYEIWLGDEWLSSYETEAEAMEEAAEWNGEV